MKYRFEHLTRCYISVILLVCLMLVAASCSKNDKIDYYSNKSNYTTETATVSGIEYDEEQEILYITISINDIPSSYSAPTFCIVGENYNTVINNGIKQVLKEDIVITYKSAPKYYGNGYWMPIIEISIEDNCYLEYDDGYTNLLNWLEKQ